MGGTGDYCEMSVKKCGNYWRKYGIKTAEFMYRRSKENDKDKLFCIWTFFPAFFARILAPQIGT